MEKNFKAYTLSVLTFLCILSLESSFAQEFALILRTLAFVLPAALCLYLCKSEVSDTHGLKIDKKAVLALPIALPSVLLIFALSYVVSLLLFAITGKESPDLTSGNIVFDVLNLALVPALLEELLFRLVPLKIIAPYSKKTALIISSTFFAVTHTSFFSIPYAFLAGIIFMGIDLITESVWPSVILHLLNNIISLVWMYGNDTPGFSVIFISVFILGAVISLIPLIFMIKRYKTALNNIFKKEDKLVFPIITLALIVPTLILALFEFI